MTIPGDEAFLAAQRADLLRFVAGAVRPDGFGYLDERGRVVEERPVELWITCRMTHVAALGALADEAPAPGGPSRAELLELAAHGVRALASGALHDAVDGGWFAAVVDGVPTVTAKQAYGHAFVILASSSAAAAGVEGAAALLEEALAVSQARFWDEAEGLSVEEWDAAWTTLDTYRGVNANMHTVEAYLAAGDVTGDAVWHRRAGRIAARVAGWARENDWRIPEHFDEAWRPLLEHNLDEPAHPFRPYGATVGHGLEWARLLLSVAHSLGEDAPEGLGEAAAALYTRAVGDGWDADGAPGFVYTTDWSGAPVVRQRMHWVLAEAVNAAEALRQHTGEPHYARDAAQWWEYADAHLIDGEHGSWHHELDPHNQPAGTVWPGKPDVYHAYQAVILPGLPLAPSFATALAQRRGAAERGEILTIGESVLDVVVGPDGRESAHPGGSPANVSVGIARLGQRAALVTELGDDAAGQAIRAHLAEAGVAVTSPWQERRTPVARARLGTDGSAAYDFDIAWTVDATAGLPGHPLHVHTGSIAAVLEPGAAAVERLASSVRATATVSYDPNIRPSLMGEPETVRPRIERWVALADVVKASEDDLEWLYPGRPVEEVLSDWASRGPALVIATLGAAGSLVQRGDARMRIAPVTVTVADTVGAGDSYMAALVDGLSRASLLGAAGRARLRTAEPGLVRSLVERAARAAAITVSRAGANPPTAEELDR